MNPQHKPWTIIASLAAFAVATLASAAVMLGSIRSVASQEDPLAHLHRPINRPRIPVVRPPEIRPIDKPGNPQPKDPDNPDNPDNPPTPRPPAKPEFTADVTIEADREGLHKLVLIISGRTVDDTGRTLAGVYVSLNLNTWEYLGLMDQPRSRRSLMIEPDVDCLEWMPEALETPQVQGLSDEDGNFRFRVTMYAPAAAKFSARLLGWHEGYAAQTPVTIAIAGNTTHDSTLVMTRAATASGRVVDDSGKPLPGARVNINGIEAVADKDGRFSLYVYMWQQSLIYAWIQDHVMAAPHAFGMPVSLQPGEIADVGDVVLKARAMGNLQLLFAGVESADHISGAMRVFDRQGQIIHTVFFDCARNSGAFDVRLDMHGLPAATYRVQIRVCGEKWWEGEMVLTVNDTPNNQFGSLYLHESAATPLPVDSIEPGIDRPMPRPRPLPRLKSDAVPAAVPGTK